nr:immunoglobulin heavy chain junction region [Macaca mulatta]
CARRVGSYFGSGYDRAFDLW